MFLIVKRSIRVLKNWAHLVMAVIANILYGFPSKRLKVIGVTGTDGKTTTTHLIYHILNAVGQKVSMLSTVTSTGLHWTTPNPFKVQKILKQAADKGDQYFVLETTSHALDQNRVYGIKYEVSVLTNITHEHLDYHRTYQTYLKAKSKLFLNSKISLINTDDKSFVEIKKILDENSKKYFTYGLKNKADFQFNYKEKIDQDLTDYNNYNYLAAFSIGKLLEISAEDIIKSLKTFKLPEGRYDIVYDKEFEVVIDFAHTPNAIGNILSSLKERLKDRKGKLIHVFGSAGKRDKSKRPIMGEESGKYADIVILTEDDPRTEDALTICNEIAPGLKKYGFEYVEQNKLDNQAKKFTIITDREMAIKKSFDLAKKGDVIALTGKGHEKSISRGRKEDPWDEEALVMKLLHNKI